MYIKVHFTMCPPQSHIQWWGGYLAIINIKLSTDNKVSIHVQTTWGWDLTVNVTKYLNAETTQKTVRWNGHQNKQTPCWLWTVCSEFVCTLTWCHSIYDQGSIYDCQHVQTTVSKVLLVHQLAKQGDVNSLRQEIRQDPGTSPSHPRGSRYIPPPPPQGIQVCSLPPGFHYFRVYFQPLQSDQINALSITCYYCLNQSCLKILHLLLPLQNLALAPSSFWCSTREMSKHVEGTVSIKDTLRNV